MTRQPYPFPQLENDYDFVGPGDEKVSVQRERTRSQPSDSPWDRLYETPTLTSIRREVFYHDPQAPQDSLDFVIKSKYDHHAEFLKSNAETLYQPETLGLPHGRVLKNRVTANEQKGKTGGNQTKDQQNMYKSLSEKRENIHSINGAIPSHHSAATNGGYSRKHDGGFYTC